MVIILIISTYLNVKRNLGMTDTAHAEKRWESDVYYYGHVAKKKRLHTSAFRVLWKEKPVLVQQTLADE